MIEDFEMYKEETKEDNEILYYFRFKFKKDGSVFYSNYQWEKTTNVLYFSLMYRIIENPMAVGKMFEEKDLDEIKNLVLSDSRHRLRNLVNPYKIRL